MIMFIIQNLLLGPLLTVDFLLNVSKKIFSEFLSQSDFKMNLGAVSLIAECSHFWMSLSSSVVSSLHKKTKWLT
jgi:hypothetical protein